MPNLAELIANEVRTPGGSCTIGRLLNPTADDGLDAAEIAADLTDALANPAIPSSAISRALAAVGQPLVATSIQRHRRGDCVCTR
jgi:hypothetical protein